MMRSISQFSILFIVLFLAVSCSEKSGKFSLEADDYEHYISYFNTMEDENIIQAIPNDSSWEWLQKNIPLFECPQENFEEIYYFRWWSLRKHIKSTPVGYAMTEFLVERSYSDKYNLISCAVGHHVAESRWLHDQSYLDEYLKVWYRGNEGEPMKKLHKFSNWTPFAAYDRFLVNLDTAFILDLYPDFIEDYQYWEKQRRHKNGLFWQKDVQDGMEEQISGGRRVKNARPTINSYMYGNAKAIAAIAELKGDAATKELYLAKADTIKSLIDTVLWNPDSLFYETVKEDGNYAGVREAIGYIPWVFGIPDDDKAVAWHQVMDTDGFLAPFGLTTAERRHPEFRTHGCCKCEWDGAVWPFATSQTLTGLANLLHHGSQNVINDSVYFDLLETYVESQYYRGRPYIGEYLDEVTGYWLKGDQERSRYYNHSTFNDLIITGLIGLEPQEGNKVIVDPLLPADRWDWFAIDKINYHGVNLAVVWDKDGSKYGGKAGLSVFVNGSLVANTSQLEKLTVNL